MLSKQPFVLWLKEIDKEDVELTGTYGLHLASMLASDITVPNAFVITTAAWFTFIESNKLKPKIDNLLSTITYSDHSSVEQVSQAIKKIILYSSYPEELAESIIKAYKKIHTQHSLPSVNVISASIGNRNTLFRLSDSTSSFMQIVGDANLLQRIKESFAKLFDTSMLLRMNEEKVSYKTLSLASIVQASINADISGRLFTKDPDSSNKKLILIEAAYGLPGYILHGEKTDYYEVDKLSLEIKTKRIANQEVMQSTIGTHTKINTLTAEESYEQKLSDKQIIEVALLAKKLEKHFYFPQEAFFAYEDNKLFLLNTRELSENTGKTDMHDAFKPLLVGTPHGVGIIKGNVRVIKNKKDLPLVKQGDVLVTQKIDLETASVLKKANAIIVEEAASPSTQLLFKQIGVPVIANSENALDILKTGQAVLVDGQKGTVYHGSADFSKLSKSHSITATKLLTTISTKTDFHKETVPYADGVGIIYGEIFFKQYNLHPKQLFKKENRNVIINTMVKTLQNLCDQYYPMPVLYKFSEFTSSQLRTLSFGKAYEEVEENPFLGYRGALRYLDDNILLKIEIDVIKEIRKRATGKNIGVLLPFVRTVSEFQSIKKLLYANGLQSSPLFKIWLLAQLPANIAELDMFVSSGLDGVSFDVATLSSLMFGIDKNNLELSQGFSDQNKSTNWLLSQGIEVAQKHKIETCYISSSVSSLAGIEFMVQCGISSITVPPEDLQQTRRVIASYEHKLLDKNG